MLDPQGTLQWQARRIEELEAEVAYMRDQLAEVMGDRRKIALVEEFGLTGQQARLLAALHRSPGVLPVEALRLAMQTDSDTPAKLTQVIICRIRAKLAEHGVSPSIETVYGVGYRLTPEGRAAVTKAIKGVEQ